MLWNGGILIYFSYMVYGPNWEFFAFEINLKKEKQGWPKAEPVERVYVKYDPKNNLPTHGATISNQRARLRSRHWQVLSLSLTRLTKTSLLYIKSYSNVILDLDLLDSNMSNGLSVHGVCRCKEITMQWPTVKVPIVLPVILERVNVDPIK